MGDVPTARGRAHAIAAGAYLGFALLTKGNAYLFAPAWIAIYVIATVRFRDRHRLKLLVLIIALACIINIPFALRNTISFGSPNWTGDQKLTNQSMSFPILMSNMAYNLALHAQFQGQSTGEDDTGNVVYLFLALSVLLGLVFYQPLQRRPYLIFGAGVVTMFVIFWPWFKTIPSTAGFIWRYLSFQPPW